MVTLLTFFGWALLVIALVTAMVVIHVFLGLVKARNTAVEAQTGIEIQLQQRFDEITSLMKIAQHYLEKETALLTEVTRIRESLSASLPLAERVAGNDKLSTIIPQIHAVSENYPELGSNQVFLQLMKSLANAETHLAGARRIYGRCVNDYYTLRQGLFGPTASKLLKTRGGPLEFDNFEAESAARSAPDPDQYFK